MSNLTANAVHSCCGWRSQGNIKDEDDADLPVTEVLAAVRTLYADRLKPYGRVLLMRLRELAAARVEEKDGLVPGSVDVETMPWLNRHRLRRTCKRCSLLRLMPEPGGEYSVLLVGRPATFMDVCSPLDPYPPELWLRFQEYLMHLPEEQCTLPGGRYSCARTLFLLNLPFFKGLPLGQVCHIVQTATAQKKILGYLNGSLVPYWKSEGWLKERCARSKTKMCSGTLPVATLDDATKGVQELLSRKTRHGREPGVITISTVKRLFRTQLQLELSETALGYTRVYDLLKHPRFEGICRVDLLRSGHVAVRCGHKEESEEAKVPRPPGVWFFGESGQMGEEEHDEHLANKTSLQIPMPKFMAKRSPETFEIGDRDDRVCAKSSGSGSDKMSSDGWPDVSYSYFGQYASSGADDEQRGWPDVPYSYFEQYASSEAGSRVMESMFDFRIPVGFVNESSYDDQLVSF